MGIHASADPLVLPLWGPARLEYKGKRLNMHNKGLAILYFLAVEGKTRRATLADVLWGYRSALQNLRVELHRLRRTMEALGLTAFQSGEDPLELPAFIRVDATPGDGKLMEGIEGVSPEFHLWVDAQRAHLQGGTAQPVAREALVHAVAADLRPPFVLVVGGPLGTGRLEFARTLARELNLHLIESLHGVGHGLRFVAAPYPDGMVARIVADRDNVYVVERPAFGEAPRAILELMERYPEGRVREVNLPPLSWDEARRGYLRRLTFADAARAYLASGGLPGVLRELAHDAARSDAPTLAPRYAARIQHELRFLSMGARLAVERLCVHPGTIDDGLIGAFEADEHLDELERRGWLTFDGGWRFTCEPARRAMYASLQPGRRARAHHVAAVQFAMRGDSVAEAHHRMLAGGPVDWRSVRLATGGWSQVTLDAWMGREPAGVNPPVQTAPVGHELAMTEPQVTGPGVKLDGGWVRFVRQPGCGEAGGVELELPAGAGLLRLRGRAHVENVLGVGVSGDACPLRLELPGAETTTVVFAAVTEAHQLGDAQVLPLTENFDRWFTVPANSRVRLVSAAESCVIEADVSVYAAARAAYGADVVQAAVIGRARPAAPALT